jgi:hypothetical protein
VLDNQCYYGAEPPSHAWGAAPQRDPARALLALPRFTSLRELELDLLPLGPPPAADGGGGGGGGGEGEEALGAPPAGGATAPTGAPPDPLAQAEALLAPLERLRPPCLRRVRLHIALGLSPSAVAELEARFSPGLQLELRLSRD